MKRDVELARKLLEGKGYKVSKKMRESAWDELDSLGVSEEEVASIADKLGFTDGVSDEQAEEILQYYKNGKSPKKSPDESSFEYKGVAVRKEGGKWVASNGARYMGYLTPRDIKQWIDQDNDNPSYYYESNKMNEGRKLSMSKFWKAYSRAGYPGKEKIRAHDAIIDILSSVETNEPGGSVADDYPSISAAWKNLTPEQLDQITKIWDEAYAEKTNESGGYAWMVNHPGYDPIGAPAPYNPTTDDEPEPHWVAHNKAKIEKLRKLQGAPADAIYDGETGYFEDPKNPDHFWDEKAKAYNWVFIDGKGWVNESEEVLKPQYESSDLKYVSNVNGYSTYRKIENGKGVWFAKRQDDPDDKMFPISYDQARGYKEMPDETEIEKLQREMGKLLLPKSESKKMRESAKEYKGYTIEYYVDSDDYSNYSEHRVKISKDGKVVTTLSAEKDPERYIDNLGESKKMRESTDDRQQRRIVKSIADEVIRSKGQNNSTGTYDRFIRKMMDNWATSGQDRDFIKSAIEKSFDKEYGVNESSKSEWQYIEYTEDGPETHYVATEEEAQREVDRLKSEGTRTKGPNPINRKDESKSPLQEALIKSIKKLHESEGLDYEDMKYWNPTAIGSKIAEYLGTDATDDEVEAELSKIIPDTDSPKFHRAYDKTLRQLDWDRESMSNDPMNGHKYQVGGATPNVTEYGTDYDVHDGGYKEDPKSAITSWLQLSQKNPTMISIDTNKNAYAQELLQWVVDNEEEFRSLCTQYRCPYKVDYMIDACHKKLERPSNFENKYNYPDQIYPFALG